MLWDSLADRWFLCPPSCETVTLGEHWLLCPPSCVPPSCVPHLWHLLIVGYGASPICDTVTLVVTLSCETPLGSCVPTSIFSCCPIILLLLLLLIVSLLIKLFSSSLLTLCDTATDSLQGLLGPSIPFLYWSLFFNTWFPIVSSLAKAATAPMWHRDEKIRVPRRALQPLQTEELPYPASTTSHGLLRPCALLFHCPWTRIAFRTRQQRG